MSYYNKEYLIKDKKTKAKEFAGYARKAIKSGKKHFVMVYECNIKEPDKSRICFDCSDISAEEIVSVMKQFIMQLSKEATIKDG